MVLSNPQTSPRRVRRRRHAVAAGGCSPCHDRQGADDSEVELQARTKGFSFEAKEQPRLLLQSRLCSVHGSGQTDILNLNVHTPPDGVARTAYQTAMRVSTLDGVFAKEKLGTPRTQERAGIPTVAPGSAPVARTSGHGITCLIVDQSIASRDGWTGAWIYI